MEIQVPFIPPDCLLCKMWPNNEKVGRHLGAHLELGAHLVILR